MYRVCISEGNVILHRRKEYMTSIFGVCAMCKLCGQVCGVRASACSVWQMGVRSESRYEVCAFCTGCVVNALVVCALCVQDVCDQ